MGLRDLTPAEAFMRRDEVRLMIWYRTSGGGGVDDDDDDEGYEAVV